MKNERDIINMIEEGLGELAYMENPEEPSEWSTKSFADEGVLTNDQGIVLTIENQTFYITVKEKQGW